MNERANSVIKTVPAASVLHSVPMFDPLKLLRKTTSAKTGEKVLKLDLSYKKMWFLLVHPRGRMLTNILRVTDQMAMFEAQLFADRDDNTLLAQFTSCHTRSESGPQYIRNAQNEALNEALDNAGFGIQLSDLVEHDDNGYGSEVLLSQVEALLREPEQTSPSEQPAPTQPAGPVQSAPSQTAATRTEVNAQGQAQGAAPAQPAGPIQTAPVQTASVQTPPPAREETRAPAPQQEKSTQHVQTAAEAPAAKPVEPVAPVAEAEPVQVAEPPQPDTISNSASEVHDHEPKEAPAGMPAGEPQPNAPASSASTETASILQMLGGIPAAAGGPASSEPAAKPKPEARPTVVAFPQAEEPAQTAETAQQSEPQTAAEPVAEPAASYTEDMTVDEIRARMTIEQAKALTVTFGPNKGWTLGQVLDRRPSSLKFYALVSPDASNAIKAGSFLLLDELAQARAG